MWGRLFLTAMFIALAFVMADQDNSTGTVASWLGAVVSLLGLWTWEETPNHQIGE